jgi:hypothetical protein
MDLHENNKTIDDTLKTNQIDLSLRYLEHA